MGLFSGIFRPITRAARGGRVDRKVDPMGASPYKDAALAARDGG